MTVGKELLKCQPEWFLGPSKIVKNIRYLVVFSQKIIIIMVILKIEKKM